MASHHAPRGSQNKDEQLFVQHPLLLSLQYFLAACRQEGRDEQDRCQAGKECQQEKKEMMMGLEQLLDRAVGRNQLIVCLGFSCSHRLHHSSFCYLMKPST